MANQANFWVSAIRFETAGKTATVADFTFGGDPLFVLPMDLVVADRTLGEAIAAAADGRIRAP